MTATSALAVTNAQVRFGGVYAFSDVSLEIAPGSRTAIIGPNGAGKTTLFNAISGLVNLSAGSIFYFGEDLIARPPHRRKMLGISRTFQHSRLFGDKTLLEEVVCGAWGMSRHGLVSALLRTPGFIAEERQVRAEAMHLLQRFGIADAAYRNTSELPGGYRRMADVARALISGPRLLLLDEVGAGLSEAEKARVIEVVNDGVEREGMTLLFIEHDLDFVKSLAQACFVLHEGKVLAHGKPDEVLGRPDVLEAYVGVPADEVQGD